MGLLSISCSDGMSAAEGGWGGGVVNFFLTSKTGGEQRSPALGNAKL